MKRPIENAMFAAALLFAMGLCMDVRAETAREAALSPAPVAVDAATWANKKTKTDKDGDGIPDSLETTLINFGGVSVQLNPLKKDVIILLDDVGVNNSNLPTVEARQIVIAMFANAPVAGANKKPENMGIALHFVWPNLGYPGNSGGSIGSFSGGNYDWSALDAIKAYTISAYNLTNIPPIYHYCLSCHDYGGSGSSGISRNDVSSFASFRAGAVDFICSLQNYQCQVAWAGATGGTIAHEFGHNLGLTHGGADHINYKPNYLSIMNYHFQFGGVTFNGSPVYDYQRVKTGKLDENKVKESKGLGKKAAGYYTKATYQGYGTVVYNVDLTRNVDWNINGAVDKGSYPMNMNYPYDTMLTVLVAEENWKNLNFTGGGAIGSAGAVNPFGGQTPGTADYPGRFMAVSDANSCQPFTDDSKAKLASPEQQSAQATMLKGLRACKIRTNGRMSVMELAD